jgi:hypothetical protein
MHGRLRSEMRSSINYHCAKRDTLRELGKTKLVLKSVLGRMGGRNHQDPLFLGTVRESDTVVDVTPIDVHTALTQHFRQWYATPFIYANNQLNIVSVHRCIMLGVICVCMEFMKVVV